MVVMGDCKGYLLNVVLSSRVLVRSAISLFQFRGISPYFVVYLVVVCARFFFRSLKTSPSAFVAGVYSVQAYSRLTCLVFDLVTGKTSCLSFFCFVYRVFLFPFWTWVSISHERLGFLFGTEWSSYIFAKIFSCTLFISRGAISRTMYLDFFHYRVIIAIDVFFRGLGELSNVHEGGLIRLLFNFYSLIDCSLSLYDLPLYAT